MPGVARESECQKESEGARMFQGLSGLVRSCQYMLGLPGVVRSFQDVPGVSRMCQELSGSLSAKSSQKVQGCSRGCQELSGSLSAKSSQKVQHGSPLGIPRQKECPPDFFNIFCPKIGEMIGEHKSEVLGMGAF